VSGARVVEVPVERILPLRAQVLRDGGSVDSARYAGDVAPDAVHLAALDDSGAVVGCASWWAEPPGWRLRGMAVRASARGQGVGRLLLDAGCARGRAAGHRLAWCEARVAASSFYERAGWVVDSPPFLTPYGPHVRMTLPLSPVGQGPP
jgi:GNAT superfamily N-acetyltransferase